MPAEWGGWRIAPTIIGAICSRLRSYRRCSVSAPSSERTTTIGSFKSEEHTSELQSLMRISYAVFCLKKKKKLTHKRQYNPSDKKEHQQYADHKQPSTTLINKNTTTNPPHDNTNQCR